MVHTFRTTSWAVAFAACAASSLSCRGAAPPANAGTTRTIDAAGMDRSVNPGDDFFRYANGTWEKMTAIPADRSMWGIGSELAEEANAHTRTLLEEMARGSGGSADERKAADYFTAYMDEAAIERRGLDGLKPELDRIAAIADRRGLADLFGRELRADVDPLNATNFYTDRLFGLFVAQDFNEPSRNTAYLLQGGLGMPDREYYLGQDAHMTDTRARYSAHVGAVLQLAGVRGAPALAGRIVELETKIARAHWSREMSSDVEKANNPWKRDDFAVKAKGLDWQTFFAAAGLGAQPAFVVWQPEAIIGESALVASEPLETWKAYLQYHVLNRWSNLLPKAFAQERFDFYGKVLSGTPQMPDRWKRAIASTNAAMGDAVGQLYVQHYFSADAKAKAQAMVADLKRAFARRIDNLDWMSAQTRAKAKEKLDTLIVGVGYPDRWRSYAGVEIVRDDARLNAERAEDADYQWNLAKLGAPVDRNEWWMTPQTVNAVNLPIQNALNFPAAILQPPYFDPAAPAADNYGAIGAVIGHEISHSFDDQGALFDATGRLSNWWTKDDFEHFKQSSARLVEQYNAYKPFPDLAVNGKLTLSENIADVAGLAAAYDAYRLSLGGKEAPSMQGLSGDQQFFVSFAQSWRSKYREAALRRRVLTNGHAPPEYRADTVRNLTPWYDAFSPQPGERLYLAPAARVSV
ncbi:MAG TPA: M13 family metallopeptidase, partial [Vicinamibacterales bacterium]